MKKYKTYKEIKGEFITNKDRPFDDLFEEGFIDSLNLVDEIIIRSYVSPSIIQGYPQLPTTYPIPSSPSPGLPAGFDESGRSYNT